MERHLSPDFVEDGQSGCRYGRAEILDLESRHVTSVRARSCCSLPSLLWRVAAKDGGGCIVAAGEMPAAEVDVSVELAHALIADQHGDLADLAIVEVANGWDNVIFRLGDDYCIRLPRRAAAAELIVHERRALAVLAPTLPLPVPVPVRVGEPGPGYPWRWNITRWLPGSIAATTPFAHAERAARSLGTFLAALHAPAPDDAPANPYRGHFIGNNTDIVRSRLAALRDDLVIDVDRAARRWDELVGDLDASRAAPSWLHGDLHAANLLVDDGELSAVIDFGDVCAGDRATDLACAWGLFDGPDRDVVRECAGQRQAIDDDTWRRAEAWALHFAVTYLAHSADNATMRQIGDRMVRALALGR